MENAHDDRGYFGIEKILQNFTNDFGLRHMIPYVNNNRPSVKVPVPFRTVHVGHVKYVLSGGI